MGTSVESGQTKQSEKASGRPQVEAQGPHPSHGSWDPSFAAPQSAHVTFMLARADPEMRNRMIVQFQRSHGNAYVQRMLQGAAMSVSRQRAGAASSPAATGPTPIAVQSETARSKPVGIQRAPAPVGPTAVGALPSRAALETLRTRATGLQVRLGTFVGNGKARVAEIRNFWATVNGVYERVYGHYSLVLAQGRAAARNEELVANVLIGTGLGIFADVALPATIINAAVRQVLSEVAPNIAQVPMQFKAGGSAAEPLAAQLPNLKQLQAVTALDKLQSTLLEIADPAPQLLANLALAAQRLVGEVRVAEARGAREMTDAQVQQEYQKLDAALSKLAGIEEKLQEAETKFEALGKYFTSLKVPSDQTAEQDIWIEWIVAQGSPPYALNNRPIANHLRDIGLSGGATDMRYGRLSVNFGRWITTWDLDAAYKSAAAELPSVKKDWQRLFGIGSA